MDDSRCCLPCMHLPAATVWWCPDPERGRFSLCLRRYELSDGERFQNTTVLANGMIITLLKNVRRDAVPKRVSYVAATPKRRLVKLASRLQARSRWRSIFE